MRSDPEGLRPARNKLIERRNIIKLNLKIQSWRTVLTLQMALEIPLLSFSSIGERVNSFEFLNEEDR